MNKQVLLQIGTSGPCGKHMKWSTLWVRRLKVVVTGGQSYQLCRFESQAKASFSTAMGRVGFLV